MRQTGGTRLVPGDTQSMTKELEMTNTSNAGAPVCACSPGDLTREGLNMATNQRTSDCVPLDWKEVYYTNCPLVSASNVDQELGWTREEYKKIGVSYGFLRSRRENNWYPHYITTWTT